MEKDTNMDRVKSIIIRTLENSSAYEIMLDDLLELVTSKSPYTYEEVETAIFELTRELQIEQILTPAIRLSKI